MGTLHCPGCGNDRVGEADIIPGTAYGGWVQGENGERTFDPDGETKVHWDGQEADEDAPCYCMNCDWSGRPDDLLTEEEYAVKQQGSVP